MTERAAPRKRLSYTQAKAKYGPIRRGQIWEKLDTGRRMCVHSQHEGGWSVRFEGGRLSKTHSLLERDIYKFYERLS